MRKMSWDHQTDVSSAAFSIVYEEKSFYVVMICPCYDIVIGVEQTIAVPGEILYCQGYILT